MRHFSRLTTALIAAVFTLATAAVAENTIYLVRHAEKENDGTRDPSLTTQGHVRALAIADMLTDKNLSKIYSTNYKRTQQTAAPTARRHGLDAISYDPSMLVDFAKTLIASAETVLVVGHSNTTPYLVSLLSGQEFAALEEQQYDHMYVVLLKDDGRVEVRIMYISPRTH